MTGYEPANVGWFSLLPPLVTMVLALLTKEVIISLLLGIIVAAVIYVIGIHGNLIQVVQVLFSILSSRLSANLNICIFLFLMGSLINLIAKSGGTRAFGEWSGRIVNGRRSAMIFAFLLSSVLFLDDYFNIITTSAISRVILDRNKVSKPKMAYILHTMASNMCILIPITSWAAVIIAQIEECGIDDPFLLFMQSIPYNLYPILNFVFILVTSLFDVDMGSMQLYEDNAVKGLSETDGSILEVRSDETDDNMNGTVWDLIIPIALLIIFSLLYMVYLGGGFGGKKTITEIFSETETAEALMYAAFTALLCTFIQYITKKLMTFRVFLEEVKEGMKSMVDTTLILVLAWTIGGVGGTLLNAGEFVGNLIALSPLPFWILPTVIFLVGALLTFSLGTTWAGFSVLIPIVINICRQTDITLVVPCISACLCGAVFGDNISPICDNTILTATTTQCNFMIHIKTETGYAVIIAFLTIIGYIIVGITKNFKLALIVVLILELVLLSIVIIIRKSSYIIELAKSIQFSYKKQVNEKENDSSVVLIS